MPNVITVTQSRQKFGVVGLGHRRGTVASVKAAVSDGDTVSSKPLDNLGIRFLGVDAPEKGLPIGKKPFPFYPLWSEPKKRKPGEKPGKNDDGKLWTKFLDGRALQQYGPQEMDPELREYLEARLKQAPEGAAKNHRYHALKADEALTAEIQKDMRRMRQKPVDFLFFLAFAYDTMDGFGRLLCYINRHQLDEQKRKDDERRETDQSYFYQERLLRDGFVNPFFMWPNVDPFIRRQRGASSSLLTSVITPAQAATLDGDAPRLKMAREFVRRARNARGGQGIGVFQRDNAQASPLALEAFELRYLGRGSLPRRWVIDLSAKPGDSHYGALIEPQKYFRVRYAEDRLYLPEEFVPLFLEHGWKKRGIPAPAPAVPVVGAPAMPGGEVVG